MPAISDESIRPWTLIYLNIIQAFRKNVTETYENHENKQIRNNKKKKIVKILHINIHFSIIIWYNQTTQYSVLF